VVFAFAFAYQAGCSSVPVKESGERLAQRAKEAAAREVNVMGTARCKRTGGETKPAEHDRRLAAVETRTDGG